jgi:SAM-dependent methyltransferase
MALRDQERKSGRRLVETWNQRLSLPALKFIYRYASRKLDADDVVFLNYGYEEDAAMGLPLSAQDEPNRFPIQLYHCTAAQADLNGKRVLEVGCGHGGGASYLVRTMHPATYVGLDLNPDGIAYCRKKHGLAGLKFAQGDAEDLPFADHSFDAVINIESSHLYPGFPRFLDEVARVLSPGGHFLYADARASSAIAQWESALSNAPMRLVSQRPINAEVVRGLEKDLQKWQVVVDRVAPVFLRGMVRKLALAPNACEVLQSGGSEYRMYCFVKP